MVSKAKTIILVEDEEILVNMYKLKLTKGGYHVLTAPDGAAGLALILQEKADLILLDVMMPKMDGFAVLAAIKKEKKISKTPVILLTNLRQDEDIKKGKEYGVVDYCIKANMTPHDLVEKIDQFFKK
ncbi:MAG: response regulator [Candidatus Komeilibacteria bacterium CG_4_10_14_0_2_um_filter_37_10]|uniref:Response regulator n=1 Tax=Candidatus Komeilibacteria bacterium CG_4_10_14_0_2_um_filter_37_10 TaxID=1974470 RepID=A0A2M7VEF0_9BACT|nr:MAG: response regulator [Candidatus Komeilibacteria bacterium CG_4_10_14_0_2_um_filter_37_10]PJA93705.1 MAG: response regulator [Candidatus Komeilibacteria bacterium CG_4_9_14_3_um_filter_37_5]